MDHIDILFDVLSRLPTKNLTRLKRVCKAWRKLISDPSFIKVHSGKKEPIAGFFLQWRYRWFCNDVKTINYIPVEAKRSQVKQMIFDFLPQDVVLMALCNGLVCCRSCYPFKDPALYVCNPLNKEWVTLKWKSPNKEATIGLAFDPCRDLTDSSTKFSLVRVEQYKAEEGMFCYSFDIYSSDAGAWKKSSEVCQCNDSLYRNKSTFIGGSLYWLTDDEKILIFNLEQELSWLLRVPVPTTEFMCIPAGCIGESEGKLHYVAISAGGIHVWVLEDILEAKWEIKQTTSLNSLEAENPNFLCDLGERAALRGNSQMSPWMDPMAFKDGWLLMKVSGRILMYHVESNKMKQVFTVAELESSSLFAAMVVPYSLSLVPLKQLRRHLSSHFFSKKEK